MFLFLSIYVISVIAFVVHVLMIPSSERTKAKLIELFLLYQIVFSLGITSFFAFFGLTFMAQYVADYIGWPACPFEQELANVNLAFGVLGILAIWYRRYFWMATVLGFSIWIFSDGLQHAYHAIVRHNYNPGNIGMPLYTDFIVPIVLMISLYFYMRTNHL